tara:strand:- start:4166 stop:4666 length:501 start_codon:yes stop_codon:yes gene_type:complete
MAFLRRIGRSLFDLQKGPVSVLQAGVDLTKPTIDVSQGTTVRTFNIKHDEVKQIVDQAIAFNQTIDRMKKDIVLCNDYVESLQRAVDRVKARSPIINPNQSTSHCIYDHIEAIEDTALILKKQYEHCLLIAAYVRNEVVEEKVKNMIEKGEVPFPDFSHDKSQSAY